MSTVLFLSHLFRSIFMMLIRESHVFELWAETKFEVCYPRRSFNATHVSASVERQ